MERIKPIIKPSLILTSDWHLREDTPVCWIGDFKREQWDSVTFVANLQEKYQLSCYSCRGFISPLETFTLVIITSNEYYSSIILYVIWDNMIYLNITWEFRDKSGYMHFRISPILSYY